MRVLQHVVGVAKPFDPEIDVGATELFFGDDSRVGPLPFVPGFDVRMLEEPTLAFLWSTISGALRSVVPSARCYSEKLAVSIDRIVGAGIPLQVIDVVRDPRDVLASIRAIAPRIGGGFDRSPGDSELSYVERFIARLATRLDAMLLRGSTASRSGTRTSCAILLAWRFESANGLAWLWM